MADTTTAVSLLHGCMIDDMSLRNLAPATQRFYLHTVTKFRRYFGHSLNRLGLEDVRAFHVYLVSQASSLVDDGALHPGCHDNDHFRAKPARPIEPRIGAARLSRGRAF